MTPKTIFTLILKIIGIYIAFNLVISLPQLLSQFPFLWLNGSDPAERIIIILGILVLLGMYLLLMRLFLFKTNWLIDKLSLDKHFDQEMIAVKVESAAVIQIATIILGGLFMADALPSLFREVVTFLQQKQIDIILVKSNGFGFMAFDACKLTLGYLLITNSKRITLWIEQKSKVKDENNVSPENKEQ